LLAAGAVFVLLGFAVPDRFVTMGDGHALQVGNEVEKLHEQIETLKEEEIIDLAKADALEKKLNQVEASASGEDPVKTWEALDHLESQAAKLAKEAAEQAISQTEKVTKAQALAEGLMEDLGKMDSKTVAEAMKELAEMTNQAAEDSKALSEELSEELAEQLKEACKNGSLTGEQLQEIAEALKECKGDISDMLGKLSKAGLIDLEAVELCEKLGEFDPEGLADFLAENCKEGMSVAAVVGAWCKSCSGRPGRGGINRGRGDAPMTWTEGTDPQGAKFKEQILPPASLAALKDSKLVAISTGSPETGKAGADSGKGALKGAAAGPGAAHTHTILPRHRGAVGRYFERKDRP
jgi:phage-related tail protein